jgi:DNA-binding XRE family transcriptional regulator
MFNNLKIEMLRARMNQGELAKAIGISYNAFNNKMNGKTEFTRSEMLAIKKELGSRKPLEELFDKEEA